jgi:uncharacterized protein (TIGR03083 family)
MQQLSPNVLYAEIGASTAKLADIVSRRDPDLPIPTCPDWNLRQLATHLGRVHRWVTQIVATRSQDFIEFNSVPDGKYPADPNDRAEWLTSGAGRLVSALRDAGAAHVWAFQTIAPASFWARRQAHETMVHRVDAELAADVEPVLSPEAAADAIDEWLGIMAGPRYGRPDARLTALPPGKTLHIHASTRQGTDAGEWLVSHAGDGISVQRQHAKADVAVTGPADRLLLVLLRRLPADDPAITVYGDASLLAGWLAGTPF